MKRFQLLVVIFFVVVTVGILSLVSLSTIVGVQAEPAARASMLEPALAVLETPVERVPAVRTTVSAGETATPSESWAPPAGSPFALVTLEDAEAWRATRANLIQWIESVDELDDIDVAAVEWTDDLAFVWGICREELALYSFVVGHSDRERVRWLNREQSVGLEAELAPCRSFMDRHVGNDSKIWSLVSDYSDEVANKIRSEGEDVEDGDQEASKWKLLRVLAEAGSPSFDAVVDLLRK